MRLIYWLLGLEDTGAIEQASEWTWYAASPTATLWIAGVVVVAIAAAGLNLLPQNIMPWRTRIGLTLLRLAGFALLLALVILTSIYLPYQLNYLSSALSLVALVLILRFFRVPARLPYVGVKVITALADGKVVVVEGSGRRITPVSFK